MSLKLFFLCAFFSLFSFPLAAQDQFPQDWIGEWAGDLQIYEQSGKVQSVPMEIHILPTDSTHIYDWTLIYKVPDKGVDRRSYRLIVADSSYVTDEQNSILLDGYLLGNVFMERFSVMGTLLIVMLEKQDDELHYRIITGKEEAIRKSGGATIENREVPIVQSFPLSAYQTAILQRKE